MSSNKINMMFTQNGNGVSKKPKTNAVHPQILKIMSRSHNKISNSNANAINVNAINANKDINIYQIQQQQLIQSSTKKSFNMNFSQLSTSKPCRSCGGP